MKRQRQAPTITRTVKLERTERSRPDRDCGKMNCMARQLRIGVQKSV